MARCFMVLCLVLAVATPAFAQDAKPIENAEFGVTITPPDKWEAAQGNDKAVANFKHSSSQSQIEVVGTKLMTPDVAEVFFKTFHKTLKESNFEEKGAGAKEKLAPEGGEGMLTTYKFAHSGVTLDVVVFEFTRGNTAWLVVGYMQEADSETYMADFKNVISTMKFK